MKHYEVELDIDYTKKTTYTEASNKRMAIIKTIREYYKDDALNVIVEIEEDDSFDTIIHLGAGYRSDIHTVEGTIKEI